MTVRGKRSHIRPEASGRRRYAALRPAAFAMAALLCAALLCACGGQTDPGAPLSSGPEEQTAAPDLVIAGGPVRYTIIRIMDAPDALTRAGTSLNKALAAKCPAWGSSISDDWYQGWNRGDLTENGEPEIVLGRCNRRESVELADSLGDDEYAFKAVGNKLLITGATDAVTAYAVTVFIDTYLSGEPADSISFPADFSVRAKREKQAGGESLRLVSWNLGAGVGSKQDVLDVLDGLQADILTLQECNPTVYKNIVTKITENSFGVMKCALSAHADSTTNYTPILYNSDRLTLVSTGVEMLDAHFPGTYTKSLAWAVFDRPDGRRFACLNLHGAVILATYKGYENKTADERNEVAGKWREDNVRQVLGKVAAIRAEYGDIPVTVSGDCNFTKVSRPYAAMTAGGFSEAEWTAVEVGKAGTKTSFTYGKKPGSGNSIDHIFGSAGVRFDYFSIIDSEKAFTGSDHYPVVADLRFTAGA